MYDPWIGTALPNSYIQDIKISKNGDLYDVDIYMYVLDNIIKGEELWSSQDSLDPDTMSNIYVKGFINYYAATTQFSVPLTDFLKGNTGTIIINKKEYKKFLYNIKISNLKLEPFRKQVTIFFKTDYNGILSSKKDVEIILDFNSNNIAQEKIYKNKSNFLYVDEYQRLLGKGVIEDISKNELIEEYVTFSKISFSGFSYAYSKDIVKEPPQKKFFSDPLYFTRCNTTIDINSIGTSCYLFYNRKNKENNQKIKLYNYPLDKIKFHIESYTKDNLPDKVINVLDTIGDNTLIRIDFVDKNKKPILLNGYYSIKAEFLKERSTVTKNYLDIINKFINYLNELNKKKDTNLPLPEISTLKEIISFLNINLIDKNILSTDYQETIKKVYKKDFYDFCISLKNILNQDVNIGLTSELIYKFNENKFSKSSYYLDGLKLSKKDSGVINVTSVIKLNNENNELKDMQVYIPKSTKTDDIRKDLDELYKNIASVRIDGYDKTISDTYPYYKQINCTSLKEKIFNIMISHGKYTTYLNVDDNLTYVFSDDKQENNFNIKTFKTVVPSYFKFSNFTFTELGTYQLPIAPLYIYNEVYVETDE